MTPQPATCRTCGSAIWWASTTGGKLMPVDKSPVDDGGLVLTLSRNGGSLSVEAYSEASHGQKRNRYVSHFVTCPQARAHRRAR